MTFKLTLLSTLLTLHKYKSIFEFGFPLSSLYLSTAKSIFVPGINCTILWSGWHNTYSSEPQKNWSWFAWFFTATLASSIEENFFAIFIARQLSRFIDTIPFSLASIKPTFITTSAREFGALLLLFILDY